MIRLLQGGRGRRKRVRSGNVTANVSFPLVLGQSGQRIYIEDIYPAVDSGRFPVKRVAGEPVEVWVDIFRDGHAVLAAELIWRAEDSKKWSRSPLKFQQNDRWAGSFTPKMAGRYRYAV